MEPKKFKKGKHQKTDWGHGVKEVRKMKESSERPPAEGGQMQVGIDDQTALGKYANLASIAHTDGEFIIDFIFMQPGRSQGKVHSRIISSPQHTKRFAAALLDNIKRYEARFGPIGEPSGEPSRSDH